MNLKEAVKILGGVVSDEEFLDFLSRKFTSRLVMEDIRGIEIKNKTKNGVVLQDWQMYVPITGKEISGELHSTIDDLYNWLISHGAKKAKREKRKPPFVMYD